MKLETFLYALICVLVVAAWIVKPKSDEEKFIEMLDRSSEKIEKMTLQTDSMIMIIDRMNKEFDKDLKRGK